MIEYTKKRVFSEPDESLLSTVSGSGTLNYIPKWTPDGSTLGNSIIYESSGSIGVGMISGLTSKFQIKGSADQTQLTLFGGPVQSVSNPFIKLISHDGDELVWINSDRPTNVFIGVNSGALNVNGFDNTFCGASAGGQNTDGSDNSFYGKRSGQFNTTGSNGCFIGAGAGLNNTTANDNINIGVHSGENTTTGGGSVNIGTSAGGTNVTGEATINIGFEAGTATTVGYNFIGGYQAGRLGSNMGRTVKIGYQAGFTGNNNNSIIIGFTAGYYETGDNVLMMDTKFRSSESDARTKALVYGTFDSDPNNQMITFNSKKIRMPYGQTGNTGLSSGDIYFDTAANILANGDLIAAKKV